MMHQLQQKNSNDSVAARMSTEFVVVAVVAFIAAVVTTIYFIISMGYEMDMPGGWKMSMMWMGMPGQTWLLSTLSFLMMWLAMMVAMMMPSVLPMFLKTRRRWISLCYMASGYFSIWQMAGFVIYLLGTSLNDAAMRSEFLSRAMPLLSAISLIAAGTMQFTGWKMTHLLRCRSPFGCTASCPHDEKSFKIGCRQGIACCACCSTLMTTQLILGIMNPIVMTVVTVVIAAEKLLPKPKLIARIAGITAIVAGIVITVHWAMINQA